MTTKRIRELFEEVLVEVLQGVPVIRDGEALMTEDGRVAITPPSAAELSVVRAYLKDAGGDDGEKGKAQVPVTGEAKGVLQEFLSRNKGALPFAPASEVKQ